MTEELEAPAAEPEQDPWWREPRFSAVDVVDLLVEYGEQRRDHAAKVVMALWKRLNPSQGDEP